MQKKTIVVMPVANEEKTIGRVLNELIDLDIMNLRVFIVMDNYSKDNTQEIVEQYERKTDGKIHLLFHEKSKGVVSCYLYGFQKALEDEADYIIEMDGGGSHLPSELSQFVEKLNEGYECVFGSRFIKNGGVINDPLYRRLLSKGGTYLGNCVLKTQFVDMTSGFEAFRREVLERMDLNKFLSKGHIYQTEMRYYCRNFKYIEVPIHYFAGDSSLNIKSVREAISVLFKIKSNELRIWR